MLYKPRDSHGLGMLPRGVYVIHESDLYRLIMRSNMPDAERFQDWVTEEVLPQIRKTGGYIAAHVKRHTSSTKLAMNSATQISIYFASEK